MDKFDELREKYPTFEYNSYTIHETENSFEVVYDFDIPGLTKFNPKWSFPKNKATALSENGRQLFEKAIFNLGMVEVISYLKATCSKELIVKAGYLDENQIMWYKKLYINGLGEFFYRNDIVSAMNIDTFLEIKCDVKNTTSVATNMQGLEGNLIPVGGGKDSVLTLEILRKENNICYIVNPRGASKDSARIAGYTEDTIYAPRRTLDSNLLELNKQGFLNGHTPFSAILAFSSYASAILLNKKYIILSNEDSANEANVAGTNINHQYSKSIEFENDFREYIKQYVCEDGPEYFSLLRPISEWQIVKGFVKNKKYFSTFKSCNVGSKQDIWCENCPKCLYVYIMLAAFLSKEEMAGIFKTDMLDNIALIDIFNGLVYPDYNKPFECVGTRREVNLSINMIIQKYIKNREELPALLRYYPFDESKLNEELEEMTNKWNKNNNLNGHFEALLRDYIM